MRLFCTLASYSERLPREAVFLAFHWPRLREVSAAGDIYHEVTRCCHHSKQSVIAEGKRMMILMVKTKKMRPTSTDPSPEITQQLVRSRAEKAPAVSLFMSSLSQQSDKLLLRGVLEKCMLCSCLAVSNKIIICGSEPENTQGHLLPDPQGTI